MSDELSLLTCGICYAKTLEQHNLTDCIAYLRAANAELRLSYEQECRIYDEACAALSAERTAREEAERERGAMIERSEMYRTQLTTHVRAGVRMREALDGLTEGARRLIPFVETSADLLADEAEPDELEEARAAVAAARAAIDLARAALAAEPGEGGPVALGHPRAAEVKNEG